MKTEIAEIKEQFKQVLEYSQDIMNPHVDELFETFLEKKDYFIKQKRMIKQQGFCEQEETEKPHK